MFYDVAQSWFNSVFWTMKESRRRFVKTEKKPRHILFSTRSSPLSWFLYFPSDSQHGQTEAHEEEAAEEDREERHAVCAAENSAHRQESNQRRIKDDQMI